MKMHVVHTVASIENQSSGPTYSVTGLANAQANLGADTAVFSLGQIGLSGSASFKDRRFVNSLGQLPLLKRLGVSSAMRRELNEAAPKVVHTHGLWMMPNTYRSHAAVFVISPRGMLSTVALSFSRQKKAFFRILFQDRALSAASLFHATAKSEYDEIRRFGLRQPVAVIPNGIEIPHAASPPAPVKSRSVLSLGRIHPKKGLDSLIRAWAEIEPTFPDWRLRIVGPDEVGHAAELSGLIRALRLNTVSIEAPVFGTAKTELMAGANIFVLPTRSENFAMTVAESLAVGVPVISTKGAPWAGLETHGCGWWVNHGPEPLAAALRCAMSMPLQELREMGTRGRAWMKRDYSWERVARMTLDAYRWSLEGGEPPTFIRVD